MRNGNLTRREAVLLTGTAALAASEPLPAIRLGRHAISKLIVGGNPVSGNNHGPAAGGRDMRDYFTAANVKKLLARCEENGINTWQSRGDRHILRLLNEYRLDGGKIQWIAQTASELADIPRNIREMAAAGAIGIYHHGAQTDKFWREGTIENAREMCKVMRGTGVQVGLGTHIPEVVDYVESKGWDIDFYMTCVYNLSRTREEAEAVAGGKFDDNELFWDPDREKMLTRVRETAKPCLIFKVYGAARKCASRETMLEALKLVFRYAKPQDAVVVGMFPKYKEQVAENCRLFRQAIAT